MKIKGEKTIYGGDIKTPEQFIEDLYKRVLSTLNKFVEERDEEFQINLLAGFVSGLMNRLKRVCEIDT